jgi:CubicO group peptidase (beta-lactamase class C family)
MTDPLGRAALARLAAASLLAFLTLSGPVAFGADSRPSGMPVFPGERWERRAPAELGMDPGQISNFRRLLGRGSFGCLVKDGYLAKTWGWEWRRRVFPAQFRGWGSATKAVLALMVTFAVQEGGIDDTDMLVRDAGWPLRSRDQGMTLRHLLDNVDGYGLPEGPGDSYAYNDYGAMLLLRTVLEGLYGIVPEDTDELEALLAHPDRLGALQFEGHGNFRLRQGLPRLNLSTCDAARIGLLLKRKGQWHGRELLSSELLAAHLRVGAPAELPRTRGELVDDYLEIGTAGGGHDETGLGPGVFGFQWWFNEDGRLWPDVPHDAFQANGHWNRHALTVIPSRGIVVAWREARAAADDPDQFNQSMNEILKTLLAALPEG